MSGFRELNRNEFIRFLEYFCEKDTLKYRNNNKTAMRPRSHQQTGENADSLFQSRAVYCKTSALQETRPEMELTHGSPY